MTPRRNLACKLKFFLICIPGDDAAILERGDAANLYYHNYIVLSKLYSIHYP